MEYFELHHEGAVNCFGAKERSAQAGTGRIQFNQFCHQRYCHVGVHVGTNDLETKAVECLRVFIYSADEEGTFPMF